MIQLIQKAVEGARQRNVLGSEVNLSVEDLFFLMRRSKEKVKRVLYQIQFKAEARRQSGNREQGEALEVGRREERSLPVDSEFLTDMFGRDFYTAEEAVQLQQDRMVRHDSRTRGMVPDEYLNYVQCRQVSFVKNLSRFRSWLSMETVLEGQSPANDVVEVLAYLAHDTVRELVELSLLVKSDMESRHSHRHHLPLPSSSHPHTLTTSQSVGTTDQSSLPSSQEEGTSVEEPVLPTTRASRSSNRKRRKSGSGDGSNDPIPGASGQDQSQNGLETESSRHGIQPSHIREALRRLSVPSNPLLPLATHCQQPSYTQKTLCL